MPKNNTRTTRTTTAPVAVATLPDSGFKVEFYFRPYHGRLDIHCEWEPRVPKFNKLTERDLNFYRAASFEVYERHPGAAKPGTIARIELGGY